MRIVSAGLRPWQVFEAAFFNKVEEVKCATVGRKARCRMGWCDCIFCGPPRFEPAAGGGEHKREFVYGGGALVTGSMVIGSSD